MIFSNKKQIFATLFAVAIVVLIFFAPKKQSVKAIEPTVEESEVSITNDKLTLEQALDLIKTGKDPMNGIFRIREIAEDHNNIEAQAYMLVFSIQSGQTGKAKERAEHLKEHLKSSNNQQKVIEILEEFISESDSDSFISEIKKYINEFKNL